jgi:hypothetical protein
MINQIFKENWLKILKFNSKVNIIEDPKELKETVRIPLTPNEVNPFLLYRLFELLYPKFINDQQNILDIVISDFELDNIVFGLYLYETTKPGIHAGIKGLPKESIEIKQDDLRNLDVLFNRIQSIIQKDHGIKISCVRLLKKRTIDLMNSHCERLTKSTYYEFIQSFLNIIQILLEQELIFIYPEPNILRFLKSSVSLLEGIKFSKVFEFIESVIPSFNALFIINSNNLPILLKIKKENTKSLHPEIELNLNLLESEKYNFNERNLLPDLKGLQADFKTDKVLSIDQSSLLIFLSELFEMEVPPSKEKVRLIFQKLLYGIRSYDLYWNMVPKPIISNTLVRFLIRLFGINLNLKKLSHWAIPDFIFGLFDTYIGLNANILIILTEQIKKTPNSNNLMLVRIENGAINKLEYISDKNFLSKVNRESLESIRLSVSEKFGFITTVFKVDKFLIKTFLSTFLINFHKASLFSILRVVKLLKTPQYFQVYPEIPPYTLIKNRRSFFLLKDALSIVIDKHDF